MTTLLTVREMALDDVKYVLQYWLESEPGFMAGMGVDLSKIPAKNELQEMLETQVQLPYRDKQSYALVWLIDSMPAGHCNVNKIRFGEDAFMHLHLWQSGTRRRGAGSQLVKKSLPFFFDHLKLKVIYSEPYALNVAPHKTLAKTGFKFVKEYITVPGTLNFEQPVKQWKFDKAWLRTQSEMETKKQ